MDTSKLFQVAELCFMFAVVMTMLFALMHCEDRPIVIDLRGAAPTRSVRFARTMRMDRHYMSTVLPTVYTVNYVLGYEDGFVVSEMRRGREVARTPVYDSLEDAAAAALRLNVGEPPPAIERRMAA